MSGCWLIPAAGYYGVPTGKNGVVWSTEVKSLTCGCFVDTALSVFCHVHLHQYSWFGHIFSAVANR